VLKKVLLVVGALVLAGIGVVVARIGPSNIIGMIRYDQRQEGALKVGDRAPDTALVALDGKTRESLLAGGKPLILVFGSFT
jgi:hypothetical protein